MSSAPQQQIASIAAPSEEQRMLRDAAAAFITRDSSIARVRSLRWQGAGFDRKTWEQMADLGWLGILVPEQYGGMGLGLGDMRAVAEELAKGLVPEPLNAVAVLARGVLQYGDNEALKQKLLPQIVQGKLIAGLAWQEEAGGLDFRSPKTTSDDGVLNGVKRFVTPVTHGTPVATAAGAEGYIVSAGNGKAGRTSLALYYLPADAKGLSVELEKRADGSFAGRLTLKDAVAEAVVAQGKTASTALARALDEATYIASAELYGVMSRAMEVTIDFLKTRVQFGRPIASFQALQHRAVDLHIQQALVLGALDDSLPLFAEGIDAFGRGATASRLKSRASDAALAIGREAIRFFGAMGITDECDIGLYLKRSIVLAGWLGNGAQHRRRFAQLSPFKVEEVSSARAGSAGVVAERPAGTDWNVLSNEDFRMEVRAFFEREYPQELRYLLRRARWAEMKDWVLKLANKGWLAPAWPKDLGGMALSPDKQVIFIEERERWGVARHPDQGVTMIGPLLMRYGTEEQKQRFLPKIISGEHVWCQGYSEPNAGSDLASLTTEAVLEGDHYVINGTKIWTSLAHDATHMFLLARTAKVDKAAKRQAGISFFLLDLNTPGVTIRPIPNIEDHAEFCQEFLENVRIPRDNLVGELNQGWTVAKTLLTFERLNNGSPRRCSYSLNKLPVVARERGLWEDAEFQSKFTRLRLDVMDLNSSYKRYADVLKQGKSPDPGISMLKIWQSETTLRLSELMLETASDAGYLRDEALDFGGEEVDVLGPFYAALHTVISSGSNDIQRNVLAKRVLDLG